MDWDTPLTTVAHYLPAETAELLLWQPPPIQQGVLTAVRALIITLEEKDACLDPITLAAELHSFVERIMEG